ncbi:MAG: DUF2252 family protein [Pseudomonadota bacterium]|nr:DUF2252 family protein [Pseudomonadota bacterium]
MKKLTDVVDGHRVIVSDPPLVERLADQETQVEFEAVSEFFARYRETLQIDRRVLIDRFSLVDVARKVVGVGSVGTSCWILLLESGDGTPLFLQLKQAVSSVLESHLKVSGFDHAGQRVVEGQQLIQATSDVLLGWATWHRDDEPPIDFYVRQLWDGKGKLDVEAMGAKRLASYAGVCGKVLAFAHGRTGDAAMIHGYLGNDSTFDDVIVEFADRYADRTEADYRRLKAAIDDGEISAVHDI